MMKVFLKNFFIVIVLFFGLSFKAYGALDVSSFNWDVDVGLEFPTYFGMHAKFSPYDKLYARVGAGIVSKLVLDTAVSSKFLDVTSSLKPEAFNLIVEALSNSTYTGVSLGYRQKPREGLFAELGYASIFKIGAAEIDSGIFSKALGHADAESSGTQYNEMGIVVHSGTARLGYMVPLHDEISLSVETGIIKPFSSQVGSLKYAEGVQGDKTEDIKKIKSMINELWMVTLSLWLSFSF